MVWGTYQVVALDQGGTHTDAERGAEKGVREGARGEVG